ncbi:hypothetical protein EWM64_g3050 [Hericium alpestre]|uniref:F-box domain-containing protein n=1 Tax=Hericium alpestre TaxID=135208 RepID=A0A4Z0A3Q1_9AGAM|nr:hypothetical protein EWM64_g3050 [Hericium alpestre]
MVRLPPELWHAVAGNVDSKKDLLRLRAVNNTLHTFATPWAFQKLRLSDWPRDLRFAQQFFGTSLIAPAVRELIYDVRDNNTEYPDSDVDEDGDIEMTGPVPRLRPLKYQPCSEDYDSEVIRSELHKAFCFIQDLTALSKLEFKFSPGCDLPEDYPECADIHLEPQFSGTYDSRAEGYVEQWVILNTILDRPVPSHLDTLILDNVAPLHTALYTRPEFASLIGRLKNLRISTYDEVDDPRFRVFWTHTMQNIVFGSLGDSLTSLSLSYRTLPLEGHRMHFQGLRLPNLASLSLEHFIVDSYTQVGDFIIRHKHGLRHLELTRCLEGNWFLELSIDMVSWTTGEETYVHYVEPVDGRFVLLDTQADDFPEQQDDFTALAELEALVASKAAASDST